MLPQRRRRRGAEQPWNGMVEVGDVPPQTGNRTPLSQSPFQSQPQPFYTRRKRSYKEREFKTSNEWCRRKPDRRQKLLAFKLVGFVTLPICCFFISSGREPSFHLRIAKGSATYGKKQRMVGSIVSSVNQPSLSQVLSVVRIDPNTLNVTSQHDTFLTPIITAHHPHDPKIQIEWLWNHKNLSNVGQWWMDSSMDSEDAIIGKPYALNDTDCVLPEQWNQQGYPTCNTLHEIDFWWHSNSQAPTHRWLLGTGSMRQAWRVESNVVLKAMKLDRDWDEDSIDRHRRDAFVSEQMTGNPRFANVHGYCGNSALYPHARGGSLADAIAAPERDNVPPVRPQGFYFSPHDTWDLEFKLDLAIQVAAAVADLHRWGTTHVPGHRPAIVHGDIDATQFVSLNPPKNDPHQGSVTYVLSDFNGARYLYYNSRTNATCPIENGMRGGRGRAPEELYEENNDDINRDYSSRWVTSKVDVYSLGNVIFSILTGEHPFHEYLIAEAQNRIKAGHRPTISDIHQQSKDPIVQGMLAVIGKCWKQEPEVRPTSAQVESSLRELVDKQRQSP